MIIVWFQCCRWILYFLLFSRLCFSHWIQCLTLKWSTVELILDRCFTQVSAFLSTDIIWSHVGQREVISMHENPPLYPLPLHASHLFNFLEGFAIYILPQNCVVLIKCKRAAHTMCSPIFACWSYSKDYKSPRLEWKWIAQHLEKKTNALKCAFYYLGCHYLSHW